MIPFEAAGFTYINWYIIHQIEKEERSVCVYGLEEAMYQKP